MSYVDPIIEAFGGARALAFAIGYPVSTVASWKSRGGIPDDHKSVVLDAAVAAGLPIGKEDFFPTRAAESAA